MSLRTDIIDDFMDGKIGDDKVVTRQEVIDRYRGKYSDKYLSVILSNSEVSRNHSLTYNSFTMRVGAGVYKIHPEIVKKRINDRADKLVSIIGSAYLQPIADLLRRLFQLPRLQVNQVQTSVNENGYSASLCVISVLCFESYTMRVRYLNRSPSIAGEKAPLIFLRKLYPNFPDFDKLEEVFVLRDLITHNHLWHIDYLRNEIEVMKILRAIRDPISGDKKYKRCIDSVNYKTKILELNIFPIRVNRIDVSKVLKTIWNALLFLESKNMQQCYVSQQTVWFEKKIINFGKLVSVVEERVKA